MEIGVGEYVRTKYGITKVIDIEENPNKEKTIYVLDKVGQTEYGAFYIMTHPFNEKQILKHSKNIIDLIEERRYCYIRILCFKI